MAITAAEVNKLRKMTGAGLMDCKKALQESNGDFDAAIDFLRKKGQKIAAKRADRDATEGAVIAKTNDAETKGVIVYVTSETDFVAKNEDFVSFANELTDLALESGVNDKASFLNVATKSGLTVQQRLDEQVGKIGEKIEIGELETVEAEFVVPYIHMGNKAGVLVGLNKAKSDDVEEGGKNVAMQIAAMKPVALNADAVDQEILDKEREIGKEKAIAEGKPEHIAEKIVEGYVKKFLQDNTLLSQQYVKDSSQNIEQYLQTIDKDLTVTAFERVTLGE